MIRKLFFCYAAMIPFYLSADAHDEGIRAERREEARRAVIKQQQELDEERREIEQHNAELRDNQ